MNFSSEKQMRSIDPYGFWSWIHASDWKKKAKRSAAMDGKRAKWILRQDLRSIQAILECIPTQIHHIHHCSSKFDLQGLEGLRLGPLRQGSRGPSYPAVAQAQSHLA